MILGTLILSQFFPCVLSASVGKLVAILLSNLFSSGSMAGTLENSAPDSPHDLFNGNLFVGPFLGTFTLESAATKVEALGNKHGRNFNLNSNPLKPS